MKTTLVIADTLIARLRKEAARRGRTVPELVEEALRLMLDGRPKAPAPLPIHRLGAACVDIHDRDALYRTMEGQ